MLAGAFAAAPFCWWLPELVVEAAPVGVVAGGTVNPIAAAAAFCLSSRWNTMKWESCFRCTVEIEYVYEYSFRSTLLCLRLPQTFVRSQNRVSVSGREHMGQVMVHC